MISSLVTALLLHLGIVQKLEERTLASDSLALAHNTAQYVHCLAQGKIGSGFDVAAAIYGSHVYARFDPSVLDPLMGKTPVRLSTKFVLGCDFNQAFLCRILR